MANVSGSSFSGSPANQGEHPSPQLAYFGVAVQLYEGAKVLASSDVPQPWALTLLAAQALECALKAYLSCGADDHALRKQNIRHNIIALWQSASDAGLSLETPIPSWAEEIGLLHGEPYYLRYSTGINGIVTPSASLQITGVGEVIELVRKKI